MSLAADQLVDRSRMRRKLTFWRIATLLLVFVAILAMLGAAGVFEQLGRKSSPHIARVEIGGVITNDRPLLELLEELGEKDSVKAVILDISTPGGSTVGGEAIYNAVRELDEIKPVATSVGTVAASAGYMIATGSRHIIAHRSSVVGSIGVIFQYGQVSELLDRIGVEMNEVKSAPLKAEPSPFRPTSPEARAMIERLVMDSYDWFVGLVAERRGLPEPRARQLADGSIFTGAQGLENGLIDEIGNLETARNWLISEAGLDEDIKVHEWKPDRDSEDYLTSPAARLLRLLGIGAGHSIENAVREVLPDRLFLDGLVSMLQSSR